MKEIGKLDFESCSLRTDYDGNMELCISIKPEYRYAAKQLLKCIRSLKNAFTLIITKRFKKRSLNQNALMWKLLTIYAETLGGGRIQKDVQPEDLYIEALDKHGIASFLMALPEEKEKLQRVYRHVKAVDSRTYGGKDLIMYKCYPGSSTYDTQDMTNLIDGIFDDLAELGVNPSTSNYVFDCYDEWQRYKEDM